MNRISIIQGLIDKIGAKSYLEVGVQAGHCFNAIICDHKVGVDPDPGSAATHIMTSDDFFAQNKEKFDACFCDGLHIKEYAFRDITNMLDILNPGGFIVVHDNLPQTRHQQDIPLTDQNEWLGNVWEAWVELRMTRSDIHQVVVDVDWGCGVIFKGHQELLKVNVPIDYDGFVRYRNHWMNVISADQFKKDYLD